MKATSTGAVYLSLLSILSLTLASQMEAPDAVPQYHVFSRQQGSPKTFWVLAKSDGTPNDLKETIDSLPYCYHFPSCYEDLQVYQCAGNTRIIFIQEELAVDPGVKEVRVYHDTHWYPAKAHMDALFLKSCNSMWLEMDRDALGLKMLLNMITGQPQKTPFIVNKMSFYDPLGWDWWLRHNEYPGKVGLPTVWVTSNRRGHVRHKPTKTQVFVMEPDATSVLSSLRPNSLEAIYEDEDVDLSSDFFTEAPDAIPIIMPGLEFQGPESISAIQLEQNIDISEMIFEDYGAEKLQCLPGPFMVRASKLLKLSGSNWGIVPAEVSNLNAGDKIYAVLYTSAN